MLFMYGDHEWMMVISKASMAHTTKKLRPEKFCCFKFLESWQVSENICTQKLQIRKFVDKKISRFTVYTKIGHDRSVVN